MTAPALRPAGWPGAVDLAAPQRRYERALGLVARRLAWSERLLQRATGASAPGIGGPLALARASAYPAEVAGTTLNTRDLAARAGLAGAAQGSPGAAPGISGGPDGSAHRSPNGDIPGPISMANLPGPARRLVQTRLGAPGVIEVQASWQRAAAAGTALTGRLALSDRLMARGARTRTEGAGDTTVVVARLRDGTAEAPSGLRRATAARVESAASEALPVRSGAPGEAEVQRASEPALHELGMTGARPPDSAWPSSNGGFVREPFPSRAPASPVPEAAALGLLPMSAVSRAQAGVPAQEHNGPAAVRLERVDPSGAAASTTLFRRIEASPGVLRAVQRRTEDAPLPDPGGTQFGVDATREPTIQLAARQTSVAELAFPSTPLAGASPAGESPVTAALTTAAHTLPIARAAVAVGPHPSAVSRARLQRSMTSIGAAAPEPAGPFVGSMVLADSGAPVLHSRSPERYVSQAREPAAHDLGAPAAQFHATRTVSRSHVVGADGTPAPSRAVTESSAGPASTPDSPAVPVMRAVRFPPSSSFGIGLESARVEWAHPSAARLRATALRTVEAAAGTPSVLQRRARDPLAYQIETQRRGSSAGPAGGAASLGAARDQADGAAPVAATAVARPAQAGSPTASAPALIWRTAAAVTGADGAIEAAPLARYRVERAPAADEPVIARQVADNPPSGSAAHGGAATPGPGAPAATPGVDLHWVAEQVGRLLQRRLDIERERRGIRAWR
jgi:hypothetical protein